MTRVMHLINDTGLGGVNRMIDVLLHRLDGRFEQVVTRVDAGQGVPPLLAADIIIVHFTVSWAKLAWLQALRWRHPATPLLLVEHSYTKAFEALHVPNRGRFRTLLRLAAGLADRVVSVSPSQHTWLADSVGVPASKLVLLRPYTDLAPLRLLRPPVRQAGPLRLCGYGRFAPQKGFDTLLAAMALVPADVATLRLVGLGPDEVALRQQSMGLPHVTIEGPVAGPADLFGEIDAVAMPSRFEAFGIVAAEARAAARPIIVSSVDGLLSHAMPMPELTVSPEAPAALAGAIRFLSTQDVAALGEWARRSVDGAEAQMIDGWNHLLGQFSPGWARAVAA